MTKKKTAFVAALAGIILWFSDAAVTALLFGGGSLNDHAFTGLAARDLYYRGMIIACVVGMVFVLSRAMTRTVSQETFHDSIGTLLAITNAARDAIIMIDDRGVITFWNPAAERIFGYGAHETIGNDICGILAPIRLMGSYRELFCPRQHERDGAAGNAIELTARTSGGAEVPVEISLSSLQLKGRSHSVCLMRDVSGRKRTNEELRAHREKLECLVEARTEELKMSNDLLQKEIDDRSRTEEELFRSETFLNTIFDSFHDPFSIMDSSFRIIKFNDAYARMWNKLSKDLGGKKCHEALHSRPSTCRDCIVEKTFQSGDPCAQERLLQLPGGEAWMEIYTYPIFGPGNVVTHVVEYSRDITDRKKEEEEKKELIRTLNHLSTTDPLTELYNRRALNDRLRHEIDRAVRYDDDLSLILCDVDRFKLINDTFGHTMGDRALISIAETLRRSLRKPDIVGRYGGDEFMIILPATSLEGAKNLANKLRTSVEQLELDAEAEKIKLSISIGVASCCEPVENIDTLVALADTALYASKEAGRNRVTAMRR